MFPLHGSWDSQSRASRTSPVLGLAVPSFPNSTGLGTRVVERRAFPTQHGVDFTPQLQSNVNYYILPVHYSCWGGILKLYAERRLQVTTALLYNIVSRVTKKTDINTHTHIHIDSSCYYLYFVYLFCILCHSTL